MEQEGHNSVEAQAEKHEWQIENAEEVVPNGWRVTYSGGGLDVPQSWAFYDGKKLLVVDPGGELPVETVQDKLSIRGVARSLARSGETPKINAIRELAEKYDTEVGAVLLTHGDADHTNNIENISDASAPIHVGKKGNWSVMSPEKQFAVGRVKMRQSKYTGGQVGELGVRDVGFQIVATMLNNQRSTLPRGAHRAAKKHEIGQRLEEHPQFYETEAGRLEVLHLPGHAPEEVGFYLPEQKLAITGDILATSKPEQADRLNLFLAEANVYDALASLQKLRELEIEKLYPAHGSPVIGQEKIQEYLGRVEADARGIIERTLKFHEENPTATIQQLRPKVFTKEWQRKGMAPRSEETWILSILRDRPVEDKGVG